MVELQRFKVIEIQEANSPAFQANSLARTKEVVRKLGRKGNDN